MPDTDPPPASTLDALCVYAEPVVAGRRVVFIGDATSGAGERLLDLGARAVHVYDPDPERARDARPSRGIAVSPLPEGDFDVRSGAFDSALVPDLSAVASPAQLLARIRRLLGSGGVALVGNRTLGAADPLLRGAPTPLDREPLDYYELYDLVALQFAHVRMVGQLRWNGVALVELGRADGSPDVSVDGQLAGDPGAPELLVAVASQEDVRLAEYALIQLPEPWADAEDVGPESRGDRANLAAAQLRASLLEAQLEEARRQRQIDSSSRADMVITLEAELANRLTRLEEAEERATSAEHRAERAVEAVRALEVEAARLRDQAALAIAEGEEERRLRSRAEIELAVSRKTAETTSSETRALAIALERVPLLEVAAAHAEATALELGRRLAASEEARAQLEAELAARGTGGASAERTATELREIAAHHGEEMHRTEVALREAARTVAALEAELARRERIVLDLVAALEDARSAHVSSGEQPARVATGGASEDSARVADLTAKLDELAMELARREGEAASAAWRIQELEQEVSRLDAEQTELTMTIPPPAFVKVEHEANDAARLSARLEQALDENEALRQALTQEHDARKRADSGEELEKARAELARQAALIEKLSRELEAHDHARGRQEELGSS